MYPMMPHDQYMMTPRDQYSYPYNLPMALQLIRQAVAGEREDEMFYDYLLNTAPSEEDKNIIRGIRDDEKKHFGLFRQIYYELTGQMIPPPPKTEFTKPKSYCMGLKRALKGELGAVEKYRKILFALQERRQINILTEIITDELRHGNLYNLLYSKNECYEEELEKEKEEKED
jgi:rubrerythrin